MSVSESLTEQVLVSNSPRLSGIKVGVSADAVTGEIGVCQESPFTVEWTAVSVETLSEEDHDVGELLHFVPYVAVRDFPEAKRSDALPHLEGLPDGFMGFVLSHLWGVVLYTARCARAWWRELKR